MSSWEPISRGYRKVLLRPRNRCTIWRAQYKDSSQDCFRRIDFSRVTYLRPAIWNFRKFWHFARITQFLTSMSEFKSDEFIIWQRKSVAVKLNVTRDAYSCIACKATVDSVKVKEKSHKVHDHIFLKQHITSQYMSEQAGDNFAG